MDQQNIPQGDPIQGAIPQLPPVQPADPMANLATAMATLANVSTMQLANNLSKAKSIQKPSPFKGEHSSNAHRVTAIPGPPPVVGRTLVSVLPEGGPGRVSCGLFL